MIKLLILLFIFFLSSGYSQSKLEKWDKAEINYALPDRSDKRTYSFKSDNAGEFLTKSFINTYWFFISDVDGDNCPFYPSCSGFFIQAVKETNIFQGTLMFADRFLRDINIVNREAKYPQHESGKFFDPPEHYFLKKENHIHSGSKK